MAEMPSGERRHRSAAGAADAEDVNHYYAKLHRESRRVDSPWSARRRVLDAFAARDLESALAV
jgi:hypothetical protein